MKPTLLLSALAAITVVVMASFGISVTPTAPLHNLPESVAAAALFVCPVADPVFDEFARALAMFKKELNMLFLFFLILTLAVAGWAFYQNLIKDKFEKSSYEHAFFLAKWLFWGTIVVSILLHAPGSFRTVGVKGTNEKFVLCESNTPGSRPVRASAVILRSKLSN